jgi:hypothetical protein
MFLYSLSQSRMEVYSFYLYIYKGSEPEAHWGRDMHRIKKACLALQASKWILMVKINLKYHFITNNLELEITMLKGFIL